MIVMELSCMVSTFMVILRNFSACSFIFVVSGRVRLIDLQRRQALQIFQERVAQRGVLPPVLGEQLLGPGLHRARWRPG